MNPCHWTEERSQGQSQVHSEPSFAKMQKTYVQAYTVESLLRTNPLPEGPAVLYAVRVLGIMPQACLEPPVRRLDLGSMLLTTVLWVELSSGVLGHQETGPSHCLSRGGFV